jgi:hypothetical protein
MYFLYGVDEMNAYRSGYVCRPACFNSRTAEWILMKFVMGVVLSEATSNSYFSISFNQ